MSFHQQTHNLAKAIYFTKIAQEYIDHVRKSNDVSFSGKQTMNIIHGKLTGAINEVKFRLGPEAYKFMEAELQSDVFVFESIMEKLAQLDEKGRWEIETIIENRIKRKGLGATT